MKDLEDGYTFKPLKGQKDLLREEAIKTNLGIADVLRKIIKNYFNGDNKK